MKKERICYNCNHYRAGHLDNRTNFLHCEIGHRLIAKEKHTIEHRLYGEPDGEIIMVTEGGDHDSSTSSGLPMLFRDDCPDWKPKKFRFDLGNPEYD